MTTKKQSLKNNPVNLTFGADPEAFIFDRQENRIVSAIDVLKYDKNQPIELDEHTKLYYDNAMAEFTIRPASSKEDFIASIGSSLSLIHEFLANNFDDRYELRVQASHEFDPEFIQHPEALKIGCNPEYNADEKSEIIPPDFSGNLRSAGGHVAIGRTDFEKVLGEEVYLMSYDSKINLARLLDYYLGIPFTLIDNDKTSTARRSIYGRPSSHRPKDFGLEYRVLSCLWITSPKLVGLVYDLSKLAVETIISNKQDKIFAIDKTMVNSAIMENNKGLAGEICGMLKLPKNIQIRLNQLKNITKWNLQKEWNLNHANVLK